MLRKRSLLLKIRRFVNNFYKIRNYHIQMRLPVEKITKDFEKMLKNKIEHNLIHAEIREATKEDTEIIINLYDRAWHSTTMPYHPVSKKNYQLINDSDYVFLIAKVDTFECAFAVIYLTGKDKEIGVIALLGVVPEFQHKGLGIIIGMACWDYFKKKRVKELRCKVFFKNKVSYSFIKALGFEEFHEEDGYFFK